MPSCLRVTVALSACVLAACASTSPPMAGAPADAPRLRAIDPPRISTDDDYVARVNREAQRRGLQVQWINPPVRRND
ncbi:conserved exported hypothetical protein [Luteimonas sp. 9C]|uniref:hypothetical protein n=1 Tax=Luteimonas sp. 9C TaxID=2653148 RepID=UPI0012F46AEF|nr:hypothetical protein [Luteimonas sp. 9C]VXB81021.1 conserved exported hypothetical protein [Luteimonas sp. 9C]